MEWMSYISGPSLAVLDRQLAAALKESYIPYRNTLSEYISQQEATERYEKLRAWRQARRHFWVSNGPFYLYSVHPVEKIVVIRRSETFSDPADKWVRFVEPRIADVEVSGPRIVKVGIPGRVSSAGDLSGEALSGRGLGVRALHAVRFPGRVD